MVVRAFRDYGVDGVMIARAALGRPWLFRQAAAAWRGDAIPADPTPAEQLDCLLRHYDYVVERFGVPPWNDVNAQICVLLCPRPYRGA